MDFYINNLSFFHASENDTEVPNIDFVPSIQRRKLSQSAKITIFVANEAAGKYNNIASVYSSRFGEWEKTVKQLENYHIEKEISPAAFGLSVHNAPIGMFSLLQNNNKSYTSISGNEQNFDMGLVEAVATLCKEDKVLYVSADERVPDIYKAKFSVKTMPLAIGFVLSKEKLSDNAAFVSIQFNDQKIKGINNYQHSLAFLSFMQGTEKEFSGNNYILSKK